MLDITLEEIVTRKEIFETYERQEYGQKALEILESHRIFPLTYGNPKLKYVNLLGLYIYFTGTMHVTPSPTIAHINADWEENLLLLNAWKKELGLEFTKQNGYISLGKNGAQYARLLATMGFYKDIHQPRIKRNTKAANGTSIPTYLIRLIENHNRMNYRSQLLARRYLRDLCTVWTVTKSKYERSRGLSIRTTAQPTKEEARTQITYLAKCFNILNPELKLCDTNIHIYNTEESCVGDIYIGWEAIRRTSGHTWLPFKVELRLKKKYSFQNMRAISSSQAH
ncbi:hypothetical protein HY486_01750 [Candidatus Woesearchaeota archaeon]|nr:hypothetical protein [Candidatus Woesearchaeota archaeon]